MNQALHIYQLIYSQNSPLVGPVHIYILYIYSRTYPILQMIKLRFSEHELLVSGNSGTLTQAAWRRKPVSLTTTPQRLCIWLQPLDNASTWILYHRPKAPHTRLVSRFTWLHLLSAKAWPIGRWSTYLEVMHRRASLLSTQNTLLHLPIMDLGS